MPSPRLYPQVVSDYFKKELELGQLLGLFPPSSAIVSSLNMNCVGVIPKGCKTEKCRLITNLPFTMKCQWWHHPRNLYTFIKSTLECTLAFVHLSWLCRSDENQLGRGSLLAKVDIESAYQLVPVHPDDWPISSYTMWWTVFFVDPMLPFSSAQLQRYLMQLPTGFYSNEVQSTSFTT